MFSDCIIFALTTGSCSGCSLLSTDGPGHGSGLVGVRRLHAGAQRWIARDADGDGRRSAEDDDEDADAACTQRSSCRAREPNDW